jgi:hypothetical protein
MVAVVRSWLVNNLVAGGGDGLTDSLAVYVLVVPTPAETVQGGLDGDHTL